MDSINVLIVEDSVIAAQVLKQLVDKHEGIVCSIVNSGEDAIEHVKSKSFSIILMDIALGAGFDGAITTREIRKVESGRHYPRSLIYAVTGHVTDKDKVYYESMGIDRVFEKPLNDEQLEWILTQAAPAAAEQIMPSNLPTINYEKIADAYYGGDQEKARKIVTEFQDEINSALMAIRKYHSDGQYKLVADIMLNIANNADYLFLNDISSMCRLLIQQYKNEKKISKKNCERMIITCKKYKLG